MSKGTLGSHELMRQSCADSLERIDEIAPSEAAAGGRHPVVSTVDR